MPESTASDLSGRAALSVAQIEASFFADGTPLHWREVAGALGMTLSEEDLDDCVFTALPADLEGDEFYLVGGFHPSGKTPAESNAVHWHLGWSPVPDEEPPHEIKVSSEAVGGYPGVLAKLSELWPEASEVSLKFSVRFSVASAADGSRPESITVRGRFRGSLSADLPKHLERMAWDGLVHTISS